jgi:hypothetical protein
LRVAILLTVGAGSALAAASRGTAILASAVLPGSGQLLLGARGRGEAQIWVEAGIWAFYGGSKYAQGLRENDARLFAGREAGAVRLADEPAYFRALERFDNADQYNENVRSDARARYPDDPDAQMDYYLANGYFGDAAWNWSSDSARMRYYNIRKSARNAALQAQFATGALVLNRLVSVVDCAFFVRVPAEARRVHLQSPSDRLGLGIAVDF